MKPILLLFWQICRLKVGPEHVPNETWFVFFVIAGNLLCVLLVSAFASTELADPQNRENFSLLATATGIVVGQTTTAVLTWLALQLRQLGNRFFATITALFGTDMLITACLGAMLVVLSLIPGEEAFVILPFLIWSIGVMGFILHRSLGVQLFTGILAAFGISIISTIMTMASTS